MSTISVLPNEKPNRTLSELEFLHNPDSKDARLGKGSFAHVKLVKEKTTGSLLALKSVDVTLDKASKSDMHNLRTEILVHRELEHPNIIKFHGYLQEENKVYMLLDYAPKGNLYSYMHKNKNLPLEHVFKFFYQTCLAINYLHGKDILHRDIKPENLLLDKDLNIKLCDFGWAARSIQDKRTTFCGTYEYMAPELVAKGTYNYKVDIWSLGILLYELFHSEAPYKGRSLQDIQASMTRETIHFNPVIQPELKDLILLILQKDPEQRPEIPLILNHPWIRYNLARIDPAYKNTMATELQQPDQQPIQQQPPQSQQSRPMSAPAVKDQQKSRAVSTPHNVEENSTVVKMSSFGLLHRQMSDSRDMVKENREIKDAVNNGYMTPGHKTQTAIFPQKEVARQGPVASPLVDKTAAGLSLSASQKNYSEGHVAQFQNDLNIKLSKNLNLQLGKAVKNGTKGMEGEINMTPEKQQKTQELIQQSQMSRSYLQRRQQGTERSVTKENMHGHNLSLIGFNQSSTGFNSTRHAYTTANTTYGNNNYENFSQAVSIPQGYKSATKSGNNLSKDFSNASVSREPLSATTKPSRIEYPNDMSRSSNGSKANFGGRLKRDGVKLDVQRFYPFGSNSSVSTNSPSQSSFEVHSAGINYNKTSWGHQSKGSLNSSPYVFTRVDSDTRLNYNNTGSANNSSYGNFSNSPYTFTQTSQGGFRGANSPVVDRNVAKDVREGGYKVNRSNTQLDMRNYGKGAYMA